MLILNYQRMSTEDGPGLRTTLFVKGCPLRCLWCHNPESLSVERQLEWYGVRCIGCGSCLRICPEKALKRTEKGIVIDRDRCTTCGKCTDVCPAEALEVTGKQATPREIFRELAKDKAYFGKEGGVTLSGGEITLQAEEAKELLALLKEEGIGTALDTCGLTTKENLDMLFPYVDIFLYDIKLMDSAKHKQFTGAGNEIILENFNYLAEKVKGTDKRIWIRTPVIPDATDSDENIRGIAKFVRGKYERWELCAFNNLCRDKYERLDKDWRFKHAELMTDERMDRLVKVARSEGATEVYRTGATRLKKGGGK